MCLESTLVSNSNLLSIKSLSVSFGGLKALSNVNLDLNANEVVGLIGPNGAGKTTFFNALSGLVDVESGTLSINGKSHKWPKPHQLVNLGISRTLQGVGLFPELSVLENVMIGDTKSSRSGLISGALGLSKNDEVKLKQRAMTALERVYASGIAEQSPLRDRARRDQSPTTTGSGPADRVIDCSDGIRDLRFSSGRHSIKGGPGRHRLHRPHWLRQRG